MSRTYERLKEKHHCTVACRFWETLDISGDLPCKTCSRPLDAHISNHPHPHVVRDNECAAFVGIADDEFED